MSTNDKGEIITVEGPREGTDGHNYWVVIVQRSLLSPFRCIQGEHRSQEDAEKDARENWGWQPPGTERLTENLYAEPLY